MVLVSSLLGLLPRASADTVTVNSSSAVTFLNSGFVVGDFPSPFTMANFTAAQTGTAASVLISTPFYIGALPDGPAAVWIGTNPSAGTSSGNTALYAISFNLASTVHQHRSIYTTLLTISWASLIPVSTSTVWPCQAPLLCSARCALQVSPRRTTIPMRTSGRCWSVAPTGSTSMQ